MEKNKLKTFNAIYTLHHRSCFLFAKSYVHREDVAEDFASDAMMKLWENFNCSDDVLNVQAFLLTVIKNLSINYLNHQKIKLDAHVSLADSSRRELELRITTLEACDPNLLFSSDIRTIYEQTLSSLPAQTRQIFTMNRTEAKTNKEIADMLDISVKGVDYHIAKALKVLRVNLRDYLPTLLFLLH